MKEININFERPIDYITYQIKQQYFDLSDNELKLIAIIYLKGLNNNIKKEIVNHNVFKSMQSVENHLTKLRKLGILINNKIVLKDTISTKSNTSIIINLTLNANKKDS
jgi:hypothetical protein